MFKWRVKEVVPVQPSQYTKYESCRRENSKLDVCGCVCFLLNILVPKTFNR